MWDEQGLSWDAHQMGAAQLLASPQEWPLNPHDQRLIDTLLARPNLPDVLHDLCQTMRQTGRKAEQEGWL